MNYAGIQTHWSRGRSGVWPRRDKGVHTDMGKWTRERVRMQQDEISKRELCRQEEIS